MHWLVELYERMAPVKLKIPLSSHFRRKRDLANFNPGQDVSFRSKERDERQLVSSQGGGDGMEGDWGQSFLRKRNSPWDLREPQILNQGMSISKDKDNEVQGNERGQHPTKICIRTRGR